MQVVFALCMESNTLEKTINSSAASGDLPRIPSMIRRTVRICDIEDGFF